MFGCVFPLSAGSILNCVDPDKLSCFVDLHNAVSKEDNILQDLAEQGLVSCKKKMLTIKQRGTAKLCCK